MYGGTIMNLDKHNIIYMDSSSIIRNIPLTRLSKIITRDNYNKYPNKIEELILAANSSSEKCYKNELLRLLRTKKLNSIITMDCSFITDNNSNSHIINLFGTFPKNTNTDIIFFDEDIPFETYKQSYYLIRNASIIIYDKLFKQISIGDHLLNTAHTSYMFCISLKDFHNTNAFFSELKNIINHTHSIPSNIL